VISRSPYRIFGEKVKRAQQIPILDVAAHFGYGPFEKYRLHELKGRCPFHSSYYPATIYLNTWKNVWWCEACGGGNSITLYQVNAGRHFKEAVLEMLEVFDV